MIKESKTWGKEVRAAIAQHFHDTSKYSNDDPYFTIERFWVNKFGKASEPAWALVRTGYSSNYDGTYYAMIMWTRDSSGKVYCSEYMGMYIECEVVGVPFYNKLLQAWYKRMGVNKPFEFVKKEASKK